MLESLRRRLGPFAATVAPSDGRSGRVVAVIECVLNQNVRDAGAAVSSAMNDELLAVCREHAVGLLQMPCPELACLGPDRERAPGQSLRQAMETEGSRRACATLAVQVADRIEAQVRAGQHVLAVLGGNVGSPGCAVHRDAAGLAASSGVLMLALQAELRRRGLEIPFRGLRDADADAAAMAEDLRWLRERLAVARPGQAP